jgi:hypothetical protein
MAGTNSHAVQYQMDARFMDARFRACGVEILVFLHTLFRGNAEEVVFCRLE